uniref:Putative acetazolamide conferring resistance protein Zam n=1 Tax=Paulinella chromatophora TaxID=39717 RepID=B1X5N9_PAUCH|nr:putative acetazolamide conferring resistance protein Zam [Paulinella chromatophora]ACB43258.1 putative acetazolamide conferring resistance protein Zam [Paulinella chromatophora]
MKFTVADLLDQLPSGTILPLAKLEKKLGLSHKTEKQQLFTAIFALTQIGILNIYEEGIERIKDKNLIEARLRCSSKCFCFALRDDGEEDIYIRDHQLNHAWNSDRVLVKVTRAGGRKRSPEGEVLCILERQTTNLLAQVERQHERLVAIPLDDRILATIELTPETPIDFDSTDSLVAEVKVDKYPLAQLSSKGHIVRMLNIKGDAAVDKELLLAKYSLYDRYLQPDFNLSEFRSEDRRDLSDQVVILLNGFNEIHKAIMPAIAIETINFEDKTTGIRLWVHAPALAERIGFGSALDFSLRKFSEALFVGGEFLPLLNSTLTEDSDFRVGEIQSALSVSLDLSPEGELIDYNFSLTSIKPTLSLNSSIIAAFIKRKPKARTFPILLRSVKDHFNLLDQLLALASQLKRRRLAIGSLDLASPDLPTKILGDQYISGPNETNNGWMVELSSMEPFGLLREFLQVAHTALGHHLTALNLPCIYALNEVPDSNAINEVAKAAAALDVSLELNNDGNVSSIQEIVTAFSTTDKARVLNQQLKAVLPGITLDNKPNFNTVAGGRIAYAPWTCGALHYSDIFNQHVLLWLLSKDKAVSSIYANTLIELGSNRCHGLIDTVRLSSDQLTTFREVITRGFINRLNAKARMASDLIADELVLIQSRQAEGLIGQVVTGIISGVQSYGFFVEIPPFNIEGLVHVSSLKDDWYEYRSKQNRLVGRKNNRSYILGDRIAVLVHKVDVIRYQIDLLVAGNSSELLQKDEGISKLTILSSLPFALN